MDEKEKREWIIAIVIFIVTIIIGILVYLYNFILLFIVIPVGLIGLEKLFK